MRARTQTNDMRSRFWHSFRNTVDLCSTSLVPMQLYFIFVPFKSKLAAYMSKEDYDVE